MAPLRVTLFPLYIWKGVFFGTKKINGFECIYGMWKSQNLIIVTTHDDYFTKPHVLSVKSHVKVYSWRLTCAVAVEDDPSSIIIHCSGSFTLRICFLNQKTSIYLSCFHVILLQNKYPHIWAKRSFYMKDDLSFSLANKVCQISNYCTFSIILYQFTFKKSQTEQNQCKPKAKSPFKH